MPGLASKLTARIPGRHEDRRRSVLLILSHPPYDGDTTWNALRLGGSLLSQGAAVRIFIMNDAIDMVRAEPVVANAEFDLAGMLRGLLARGARVKICTTCINRCGIGQGEVIPEAVLSTMDDLAFWVVDSDRVVVF
ncbi:MAG: hypothetical protein Kow0010_05740 [Dehalococcoidia bacterium]